MAQPVTSHISDFNTVLEQQGFSFIKIDSNSTDVPVYNRKHFYKISLITGKSIIHFADKEFEADGTTLFFGTPYIPYAWEFVSEKQDGFTCLFAESFLKGQTNRSQSLQESPLFKIGGMPVFTVGEENAFITTVFQKMFDEQDSDYVFKNELIRNYINLIIHEALKMQPSQSFVKHTGASSRIASLFLELLERQFPIENIAAPLQLRTPGDFAERLAVHVNHLNRSVKEVTGKPTIYHIRARIVNEARALLIDTDWNISDIAYALGFEYPSHFNNYFKRIAGTTPRSLRSEKV
ncbi:MAG: AraC family transcriptional regulator [Bacteroidetes bacterium]|nr:AraC family transcriptional regulator [Bacteroidota bacterium]